MSDKNENWMDLFFSGGKNAGRQFSHTSSLKEPFFSLIKCLAQNSEMRLRFVQIYEFHYEIIDEIANITKML